MFYFFNRGSDYVRCEIRPSILTNGFYEIAITEPGGAERVESFESSDEAHRHWLRVQQQFLQQGWWGPHGQRD